MVEGVAQLVKHLPSMHEVLGSNPLHYISITRQSTCGTDWEDYKVFLYYMASLRTARTT